MNRTYQDQYKPKKHEEHTQAIYKHTLSHPYIYANKCTHIHTHIYTYIHTCTQIPIYTYIHPHIHIQVYFEPKYWMYAYTSVVQVTSKL